MRAQTWSWIALWALATAAYAQDTDDVLQHFQSYLSSCAVAKIQRSGSQFRVYSMDHSFYYEFDMDDFETPSKLDVQSASGIATQFAMTCREMACVSVFSATLDGQWQPMNPTAMFAVDCTNDVMRRLYKLAYLYHQSQQGDESND